MAAFLICAAIPLGGSLARVTEEGVPAVPDVSPEFEAVPIAGPFEFPWSIAFLSDGSLLLTERRGRLQLLEPESNVREVAGVPAVLFGGQSGLLDVSVDPGFHDNGIVYLSYVHGTEASSTIRVLRAKLDEQRQRLRKKQVIFESSPPAPSNAQLGGRIAVTKDGYLFLTLGDRWEGERAQDLADHAGSIIRIRTDGSVPEDNPFVSVPGARPEIWSYGHRNPQGLAYHAPSGQLWSHEHGPKGGDELNLIISRRNYGWPVITHGVGYDDEPIGEGTAKDGMEQPVHHWTPAIAPSGLALEGLDDVTGLWIGALAGQALVRLEIENGRITADQRLLQGELGRIRDVRIDAAGLVYFITDGPAGALYRLAPAAELAHQRKRNAPDERNRKRL
ncbi:PQQ-dependent sugar dehydrogenase [Vineibacter terrae]|uniref:PQQ-dependent sugar dehydrogenase n=1 Tax=Vineibacter terrae TaxID=2586908 RepID=UPI0015B67A15|nr:PQQ-dependent sugar dehydrogenase [Vineibacter terrae]